MEDYLSHGEAGLCEANYQGIQNANEAEMSTFKCDYPRCDKIFRFSSEYQRHFSAHDEQRPYRCPYTQICNKSFKRSDALKTHMRLHTGEKPFVCPVESCKYPFSTKAGLRYHILKHKNDKVYRCDFPGCSQAFLTPTQLNQHKRRVRVHENLVYCPQFQGQGQSQPHSQGQDDEVYKESSASEYIPMMNDSFHLEPAISKRVHLEQPQENSTNLSPLSSNQEAITNLAEKLKKPPLDILQIEGLKSALGLDTSKTDPKSDCKKDQTSLLKKISDILDENIVLKQHIQIYQKIVEICRIGLGQNPLISMINSLTTTYTTT